MVCRVDVFRRRYIRFLIAFVVPRIERDLMRWLPEWVADVTQKNALVFAAAATLPIGCTDSPHFSLVDAVEFNTIRRRESVAGCLYRRPSTGTAGPR